HLGHGYHSDLHSFPTRRSSDLDARRLNLPVNKAFDGKLVRVDGKTKAVDMGKGLKMTVVGPMKQELLNLQKEHDAFLKKSQKEKDRKSTRLNSSHQIISYAVFC